MEIDLTEINNSLIDKSDLSAREKEFAKKVLAVKTENAKCLKVVLDGIIKEFAQKESNEILGLYDKYIKETSSFPNVPARCYACFYWDRNLSKCTATGYPCHRKDASGVQG